MTVTGVLKHVRLLEDARLVSTQKVGRVRCAGWRRRRRSTRPRAGSTPAAALEARLDRFEAHIARLEGQQP